MVGQRQHPPTGRPCQLQQTAVVIPSGWGTNPIRQLGPASNVHTIAALPTCVSACCAASARYAEARWLPDPASHWLGVTLLEVVREDEGKGEASEERAGERNSAGWGGQGRGGGTRPGVNKLHTLLQQQSSGTGTLLRSEAGNGSKQAGAWREWAGCGTHAGAANAAIQRYGWRHHLESGCMQIADGPIEHMPPPHNRAAPLT